MKNLIERILSLMNMPADKALHMLYGMVWFALAHFFLAPQYAFLAVVAIMVGKEAYDSMHPDIHTADFWDAVAGGAGGAVGWLCTLPALSL